MFCINKKHAKDLPPSHTAALLPHCSGGDSSSGGGMVGI